MIVSGHWELDLPKKNNKLTLKDAAGHQFKERTGPMAFRTSRFLTFPPCL